MEEAVPVAGGGQRKQLLAAGAHGGPPVQATCKHQRKDMVAVYTGRLTSRLAKDQHRRRKFIMVKQ